MITLVTVTYNAEKTVERTLQSVAQQTYKDYEHIIIDGASKDNTIEIIKSFGYVDIAYSQTLPLRGPGGFVSEPDKGLYDAMNKALKIAKGDFICFLNAGDKLHSPETLAQVAAVADRQAVGVVYGDTDIVDDQGYKLRGRRLTPPEHLTWRSFREGMLVCHQSFYVNKDIAQQYDLHYRFSADFDWCIRCMKEGECRGLTNVFVKNTDRMASPLGGRGALTDYLSEGMTTANHKASLKERFWIMSKHYGFISTVLQHAWFVLRSIIKK